MRQELNVIFYQDGVPTRAIFKLPEVSVADFNPKDHVKVLLHWTDNGEELSNNMIRVWQVCSHENDQEGIELEETGKMGLLKY